jgi:iron complex outermembrane receptor protein
MMDRKGRGNSARTAWLGASTAVIAAILATPVWAQDSAQTPSATAAEDDQSTTEGTDGTITVTARRKALADAISIKRDADTIVDAVVADDAGQLPDNSITEVLQRISGVSISRFGGTNGGSTAFQIEGSGITVRGLPFNSSTLNGQQLFSANGASAISWNEVTPELMAAVEVYKGSRADLIEGGASLINLRTHVPFDFNEPQFNVTVGASYGTQVKRASPRISAMYTRRFDTGIGEIGVLWDLAFSRLHQQSSNLQVGAMFAEYTPSSVRDDSLAFVPSSFNWNYNRSKRDRYGAYQALQWKPSPDLTLTNTVFFSQYVEDSLGNSGGLGRTPSASAAVMPAVGEPVEYDENGAFRRGRLVVGSTGKSVDWENTTASDTFRAANGSWFPAQYMIDCGATYGTPASTIQWDWSPGAVLAQCGPAGTLNPSSGSSASHGKSSTLDISQSFVWTPGDRVALRGGVQYVDSRATGKQMYVGISQNSPLLTSMDVDLTGSLPVLSGLNPDGMLDPSTAYFSAMGYHEPDNRGKMLAGNFDLEYRVSDDAFLRTVTVGARAARRTEHDNFAGTYWAPLGQSWLANPWGAHPGDPTYGPGNIQYLNNVNVPASDYTVTTFPNYFGGAVPVPAQLFVASPALMRSYDWYHLLQTYNGTPVTIEGVTYTDPTAEQYWDEYIDQGLNETRTRITNVAAYIQARFAHDGPLRFSGNIGVRVFHDKLRGSALLSTPNAQNLALTEADSTAYFNATQGLPGATFPTLYSFEEGYFLQTRKYEYTRVLPSFNIKFDVTDKFIVRGAASIAAAPPNLNDIRPGGSIGARSVPNSTNSQAPSVLTGVQVNGGGANLKPTMITSQDLAFEFYPSSSSFIYLGLFAKQIKDHPIFYSFIAENLPIPAIAVDGDPDAPGGATETPTTLDLEWLYLQNKTADRKATIKGFEIGGRKFFDNLPGLLSGFGIEGNLTYIDSSNPSQQANNVLNGGLNEDATIPQSYPDLPYAGLSKWAYNIQLLYSRGKVNARLAYNWRDKALLSTNVNPLSFATSGGNPYWLNTSSTNFDADHSFQVWHMVPAYTAAAGYLDFGFDYKVSEAVSLSFHAGNILNTKSKTYQEPVPGVFVPYDFNVSDRRYDLSMRFKF